MKDKVLERLQLENRLTLLSSIRKQAERGDLHIEGTRGQYKLKHEVRMNIIVNIDTEIEFINLQIQELTGLDQEKMEKYYKVVEG